MLYHTQDDRRQAKELIIYRAGNHTKTSSSSTFSSVSDTSTMPLTSTLSSITTQPSKSKIKSFREKCGVISDIDSRMKKTYGINQELLRYECIESTDNDTFDTFWKRNSPILPILSDMARRYGCIPATSVPSESSFSIAGYLVRKTRTSLTAKNLKYSMFLKDKL